MRTVVEARKLSPPSASAAAVAACLCAASLPHLAPQRRLADKARMRGVTIRAERSFARGRCATAPVARKSSSSADAHSADGFDLEADARRVKRRVTIVIVVWKRHASVRACCEGSQPVGEMSISTAWVSASVISSKSSMAVSSDRAMPRSNVGPSRASKAMVSING
eukprot:scaffold9836_cov26-Tisochrysis_lutea.AAC.1